MSRTVSTEPQCLYSRAVPLLPLWAVRSVQSLSACTRVHFALVAHLLQKPSAFSRTIRFILKYIRSHQQPFYAILIHYPSSYPLSQRKCGNCTTARALKYMYRTLKHKSHWNDAQGTPGCMFYTSTHPFPSARVNYSTILWYCYQAPGLRSVQWDIWYLFIYCSWVSTCWQWSVDLYKNRNGDSYIHGEKQNTKQCKNKECTKEKTKIENNTQNSTKNIYKGENKNRKQYIEQYKKQRIRKIEHKKHKNNIKT